MPSLTFMPIMLNLKQLSPFRREMCCPGEIPGNKLKLIKAWIEIHQEELMADWKLAVEGQQPFKIEPLR